MLVLLCPVQSSKCLVVFTSMMATDTVRTSYIQHWIRKYIIDDDDCVMCAGTAGFPVSLLEV